MKVHELIKVLTTVDPNMDIAYWDTERGVAFNIRWVYKAKSKFVAECEYIYVDDNEEKEVLLERLLREDEYMTTCIKDAILLE